ncbi:hypothetical protein T01_3222 [Trichinella spiralis]|uniref:Uncharacterized protein n=1 Tax=Trichinella spiralis TaxID=6334 RepID=A0A0V1AQV2_TRISP|nr:hypothetical protein T01_3222 [Trichinella spiralis]
MWLASFLLLLRNNRWNRLNFATRGLAIFFWTVSRAPRNFMGRFSTLAFFHFYASGDVIPHQPDRTDESAPNTVKKSAFYGYQNPYLRTTRSCQCYTFHVSSQSQTRVKLNRVFFPR